MNSDLFTETASTHMLSLLEQELYKSTGQVHRQYTDNNRWETLSRHIHPHEIIQLA